MKKIILKLFSIILTSLLSINSVHADSEKIFSKITKNVYQRFDTGNIVWGQAKLNCEKIGADLATITSFTEESIIEQNLLKNTTEYYFIGGTDAASQTKWQWITGEKWGYQLWSAGGDNGTQPSSRPDEDYLLIGPNSPAQGIAWFDINSTTPEYGYICEWSSNKIIAKTIVSDLNNNKANEIAELSVDYQSGKHIVKIKDTRTKKLLNTLTFATDVTTLPKGIIALKDLNGNGIPEIGVLYKSKNQPAVLIKDAKAKAGNSLLKKLIFLNSNYEGQVLTVSPDRNGNGADEITVIARNKATLATITETRDSKTGKILTF